MDEHCHRSLQLWRTKQKSDYKRHHQPCNRLLISSNHCQTTLQAVGRVFSAAKLRKPTKTKWMASTSHANGL